MGADLSKGLGIDTGTQLLDRVDKVVGQVDTNLQNIERIAQDTIRTGATTLDNARGDVLSTTRQFESDAAAIIDSAIDNANTTINSVTIAFFDTIQILSILVFGGILLFIMFYGDKVFANGISLGRINLI